MKTAHNPLTQDLDALLAAGEHLWEGLRGARIFVTGGTGFFGRWLVESFVHINRTRELGANMVLLSRDPSAFAASGAHLLVDGSVTLVQGDVRHFIAPAGSFTHVIHAATDSSGLQKQQGRLQMADTILTGTRRILDFARDSGAKRMLYVSSGAIYGRSRDAAIPIAETTATAPLITDPAIEYDEAKRMAEALCVLYQREFNVPVSIARGFSFVGPHLPLDTHFAIGNFIRDALAGKSIRVSGDGSAVRSYLYAADLARWLWTILLDGKPAQAYNVGSGEAVSIAALATAVQQAIDPKLSVEILGKPVAGAPLNYQVPDITRAEAELGLRPTVSLAESIRRTAEWHRSNPSMPATRGISIAAILAKPDAVIFDFDGVMTDNRVAVSEDGRESVFCNRSDGLGIDNLRKRGIPMLVLSKEKNPVVAARCQKLGIECMQGIDTKEAALPVWLSTHGYDAARTIYLGNDINDLGCMQLVGLPVAVGDAYPEAKAMAQLVLVNAGGYGAVRELADRIGAAGDA